MNLKKKCDICQGIGLEKRIAIKCPCLSTFCYKCQNREGFIVKPWEECRKCFGLGTNLKKEDQDINLKKEDQDIKLKKENQYIKLKKDKDIDLKKI